MENGTVTKGFRRQDNECVRCPDEPWLVVALFCVVILIACMAAYILNKKKFNLSFVSIGVDYFQVLSLFRNAKTKWPPQLLYFFRLLSIFMIDVDIAAPECMIPSLEYNTKWWGTMLIPLIVAVFLVLVYIIQYCWSFGKQICMRCYRSDTDSLNVKPPDLNSLIALYITFFYFAYILLAEKGLEVFNCNPTDPDDGHTYTDFTSAKYCNGGMCRCYDPSQLQASLIAPAIILLLLYGLGFPVFVLVTILKNKPMIKEDQLLRASNLGGEKLTNPYAWNIRHKYSKLYYPFKPGKIYWMEYIIARKVGIAFAGLFFRANPGFQLSFVLLILFASYVLQVKHRPYMSSSERMLVLEEHMMKVIMAGELEAEGLKIPGTLKRHQIFAEHLRVAKEAKENEDRQSKRDRRRKMKSLDTIAKDMEDEEKRDKNAGSYFFDYNTVEQYLLASLILICLSGIMFESDRFGSDSAGATNSHFEWQRELITVMVFTVIALSLFYYCMVFCAEVLTCTPVCLKYWHDRKQTRKGKRKTSMAQLEAGNSQHRMSKRGSSSENDKNRTRRDSMTSLGDSLQEQARLILLERKLEEVREEERKKANDETGHLKKRLEHLESSTTNSLANHDAETNKQDLITSPKKIRTNKLDRKNSKGKRKKGKKGRKKNTRKSFDLKASRVRDDFFSSSIGDGKDKVMEISDTVSDTVSNTVSTSIKSTEPVHVTADWWLYNQSGQVYYYNTVSQQSVWNRKDIPELAGLNTLAGSSEGSLEMKTEDMQDMQVQGNPMHMSAVAKKKQADQGEKVESKPSEKKSSKKSASELWNKLKSKKKSEMKLRMRQQALWNKQAEVRKKNYEKHLVVKSKWQKGALKALMQKRKSEGNTKGMVDLAFRRGSMLAKLKNLVNEEKKNNLETAAAVAEATKAVEMEMKKPASEVASNSTGKPKLKAVAKSIARLRRVSLLAQKMKQNGMTAKADENKKIKEVELKVVVNQPTSITNIINKDTAPTVKKIMTAASAVPPSAATAATISAATAASGAASITATTAAVATATVKKPVRKTARKASFKALAKSVIQLKRAPIKSRSKFSERLRRSSTFSIERAKKRVNHRDLQLKKKEEEDE